LFADVLYGWPFCRKTTKYHYVCNKQQRRTVNLTELHQRLITLVEYEVFDVLEVEVSGSDECQDASRRADDNVRAVVAKRLFILLHQHAAKEHGDLHAVHVLGEAFVLLADLECQLAGVAEHQHRHLQTHTSTTVNDHLVNLICLQIQRQGWGYEMGAKADWVSTD